MFNSLNRNQIIRGEEMAGQPTKYKEEYNEQVFKLCKLGAKDSEIADFFGICVATLTNWKREHDEFLASIKRGKDIFDSDMVERSLRDRAIGYSHKEEKIFNNNGEIVRADTVKHYPPDTTACIFWLKNRQSKKWRDKIEVDNKNVDDSGNVIPPAPVVIINKSMTPEELEDIGFVKS